MHSCLPSPAVAVLSVPAQLAALALLAVTAGTCAQPKPGEVSTTINLSTLAQSDTDLDQGGRFHWAGVSLNAGVSKQFTPAWSAGVSGRYATEHWSFDLPGAFGPVAPWTDIVRPNVEFNVGLNLAPDLSTFLTPQVEWSYETGAGASNAKTYGAVVGALKVFSPTLVVGLGVGAFRQIDRRQYVAFPIVSWQINDTLRLSNPLRAGPAGGAGLELSQAWSAAWEAGAGVAYREYRFRLRPDGPVPNGVGQNQGLPVFARLGRKFGPAGQLDLVVGTVVGGKLQLIDPAGSTVQSSGYGSAPLVALTGTLRF